MRHKHLQSRREFVKTVAVGTGLAAAGTTAVTAAMKLAGLWKRPCPYRLGGKKPPLPEDRRSICGRCRLSPEECPFSG